MISGIMSGKNYKKCRYCQNCDAVSNEHIIVNSRLRSINAFKNSTQRNDNVQKAYKNITCNTCNHILGEYESKRWSSLAYATIWKILAGNVNNIFNEGSEYILKHSDEYCMKNFENQLLTIIKSKNLVLPEHTFTFSIDPKTLDFENKPGKACQKVVFNFVDESGLPIEGASAYVKPKGGSEKEKGYYSQSNKAGKAFLNILMRLEMIKIVSEKLTIRNDKTKEEIYKDVDVIIYISLNPNSHRSLVILPLICKYDTGWPNTPIKLSHKGFLRIVQKHISDIKIIKLKPIRNSEHNSTTD